MLLLKDAILCNSAMRVFEPAISVDFMFRFTSSWLPVMEIKPGVEAVFAKRYNITGSDCKSELAG